MCVCFLRKLPFWLRGEKGVTAFCPPLLVFLARRTQLGIFGNPLTVGGVHRNMPGFCGVLLSGVGMGANAVISRKGIHRASRRDGRGG